MRWKKVTLVGVGLLGGSLGRALRERKLAEKVAGFVRSAQRVRECLSAQAVDEAVLDLEEAVAGADLVVFCTPIGQMKPLAQRMAPALEKGTLVTDVGSVKGGLVSDLEPVIAAVGATFVGSHPMAGSHRTGVSHADPELFKDAICVVTPTGRESPDAVDRVKGLWSSVKGIPLELSPADHDRYVALSSHLPHVTASVLAECVLRGEREQLTVQGKVCGSGFADTTRLAAGSPEMWRDICEWNRESLLGAIDRMMEELAGFRKRLEQEDWEGIEALLREAARQRERWEERMDSFRAGSR